jgi:hypothetical protein
MLAGLQNALGGLTGGGGGGSRPTPYTDPFAGLAGNDLANAGRAYFDAAQPGIIEGHRQQQAAIGDPRADWNAADEAMMTSSGRSPSWASYFGILRGKADAARASGRGFGVQYNTTGLE